MVVFRVAIIGCGSVFSLHSSALNAIDGAEIVAVCDIKEKIAKLRASECNCNYYTDYKKMILAEKPDVIHICLPHYLHGEASVFAMENGCHVLCEKPMEISVASAQKMIRVSEAQKKALGVIFQNRYNNASKMMKYSLESGELGDILGGRMSLWWSRNADYYKSSSWKGRIKYEGGGVVVSQAVHVLDLLLWMVGKVPYSVNADINNFDHDDIEAEDSAYGVIRFDNGALIHFNFTNSYSYNAPMEIEIQCQNGMAKLVGDRATITYNSGRVDTFSAEDSNTNSEYSNAKPYWITSHFLQTDDFYNALKRGDSQFMDLESVFTTTKVMCAILKSGR